ncbi:MAG: relaxase domain-containing protein, partial [Solirubrobacteraceae bacterium]
MLTIGKIGGDRRQQLYYDSQVAQGAEDYHAGKGEAPGSWHSDAAAESGLSGSPTSEQLLRTFAGRHPGTGEQLARRHSSAVALALAWMVIGGLRSRRSRPCAHHLRRGPLSV